MSCGEVCIANRRLDTTSLAQQCKEGFRSGVGSPSACGVAMLSVAIQVREAARQNYSQLGPWMTAAFILISAPGFAGKRCWVELSARLASSRLCGRGRLRHNYIVFRDIIVPSPLLFIRLALVGIGRGSQQLPIRVFPQSLGVL